MGRCYVAGRGAALEPRTPLELSPFPSCGAKGFWSFGL